MLVAPAKKGVVPIPSSAGAPRSHSVGMIYIIIMLICVGTWHTMWYVVSNVEKVGVPIPCIAAPHCLMDHESWPVHPAIYEGYTCIYVSVRLDV